MKSEKKNYPGVNLGSASMLVIFMILCLVIFSVLSIASANKDYNYSKKIAERTHHYYEASNQAEELLDKIQHILADSYKEDTEHFLEKVPDSLKDIDGLTYLDFPTLSYEIPISEKQALFVSLTIKIPTKEDSSFYTITSWQEISTEEWDADTTFHLI